MTNITKDCNIDEQKDYSTTREAPKNQVQAHPQSKHNPTPRSAQRVTHDINISDQTNDGSMSPKRTFIETNIRIKNVNMNSVSSKPNGHNKAERIIENTDKADFETRKDDENKNENEWERDFREKQDADTDRERERENSINSNTYIRNACISSLGFRVSGTDKIDLKSYPSSPTRILDFKSSSNSTVTTTTTSSSTSSSVNDISDTFPTREKNNSQTQNGISSACVGKGKGKIKESTMKIGTDKLNIADVGVGYGVGVGAGVISGSEVVSRVRGGLVFGLGVTLSEEELIELLSLPPKSCPALRTKSGYQDFFTGMNTMKMKDLLEKGYDRMSDKLRKEEGRGERGRKGEKEIISGDGREDNESLMEANKEIEKEADVKKMKIKRRMDMLRGVLTN